MAIPQEKLEFSSSFKDAITAMPTPLDYTLSPPALLLQLINYDNGTNLTLKMVSLSPPVPVTGGVRNTRVTVSPTPGSQYANDQDVFYNRINLSALGALDFLADTPYDSADLLAAINSAKLAGLYLSDLEDFPLTPVPEIGEVRTFNLTARPDSIRWIGQAPLSFTYGLPANMRDFDTLINVTLPSPGYLLGIAEP